MLGKLVPCGGGAPVPLVKATLVVGRNPDCDIPIFCKTVSGRHCELQFHEGSWWVRDLGSKNGTAVNGVLCVKERLAPDAVLAIGRQRYILTYPSGATKPPPATVKQDVEALALNYLTGGDEPALARPTPAPPRPQRPPAASSRPQTQAALGKLIPCGGGDPIPLMLPELLVGRSPACNVCLRFPSVSAKHCKLKWQDGYWLVEDLNSSNGTWVNGARCQRKCLLPESVLALAKHRFTIHYTPTGDTPPADEENLFGQSLLEKLGLSKQLGDESARGEATDL